MKKLLLILLALLCGLPLFPQNEAANWYFGFNAGIQFDINSGAVNSVDNGQLSTNEGCASISDSNGDLLFYTDGITVYNRDHEVMTNGDGLFGDPSSTQSAIIVPKPNDPDIYYIFTVDVFLGMPDEIPLQGFNYSEVDMTLDGGLGAVTNKNIRLLDRTSEKISAVLKDCEDQSIWVMTFAATDGGSGPFDTFHAFEVNENGIVTTSVKSTFPVGIVDVRGYLKFSPSGEKLASVNMTGSNTTIADDNVVFLYDFESESGVVSNQQTYAINTSSSFPYGVEFSPNSRFLYVHSSNDQSAAAPASFHAATLTQFDLEATDIQASEYTVDESQLYRGALQLGPNGKIYRALSENYVTGIPFLGVINNPNEPGAACNYQPNAIALAPNNSTQGLPPFIQSFFEEQIDIIQNDISTLYLDLCTGDSYTLMAEDIPGAIYSWTLDGNPLPEDDFDLIINSPGHYEVEIDLNNEECEFKKGQAFVEYFEIPEAFPTSEILICDDDFDGQFAFTFTESTADILGTQDPATFQVKYYLSFDDANNNENELTLPFINTAITHQIFARIDNIGFNGCYDIVDFTISVYSAAFANAVNDLEVCDDLTDGDDMNGQSTTDLSVISDIVLGVQNPADYSVSFHLTQNDADTNTGALPLSYYNSTPDFQTIYVRIENNLQPDCYDTTSFNIIINRIPEALDTLLFQCDEDGNPDGFTLFNLTEAFDVMSGGHPDRSAKYFLTENDAINGTNEIDGNSFANTINPQIIYVQIIDDLSGCLNIAELTLDVSATNVNDATLFACDDDGLEDGFYAFDLTLATADVLTGAPTDVTVEYYTTYEDALLEVNALGTSFTNTTPYSQLIYVRAENDNACYGINEVQLILYELPEIETEETVIYCLNYYPETITLTGGVINDSPENYFYDWSTGESTPEIEINEVGIYTVIVTNQDGCSKLRTITVNPSNIATIESVEVVDGAEFGSATIIVSGEGDYEFAIDDINGPYQDSNFFDNLSPGFHTIYVRDKNECGIVEKQISIIGFPKFFTPNGDSYNDTWQVYGVNSQFQPNTIIYIFDRYGKLLKQLSASSPGWDGTFNGERMPDNDYWFEVTLEDGRVYRNHFALKR